MVVRGQSGPTCFIALVAVGDLFRRRDDRWAELRGGSQPPILQVFSSRPDITDTLVAIDRVERAPPE
eukprot:1415933-Lingulodinium_polyedra.AAC.1